MYCEFATGSDSFSMGGRNIQLVVMVYNPKTALFENPKNVENENPVVRDVKVTQGIPANLIPVSRSINMWYYHRCECRSGSLWLYHFRRRVNSLFMFENEYMLVRMSAKAPLIRARLNFPPQIDSNIEHLEFVWNAKRITTAEQLIPDERNAFKRFVGDSFPDAVIEVTQSSDELPSWKFDMLEQEEVRSTKLHKVGKRNVAVDRVRKIRL